MRLGIDMDGVTVDFIGSALAAYEESYGVLIPREEITDWDSIYTLTHFQDDGYWSWLEHEHPRVFHNTEAIPGSIDALAELNDDGHEIIIITSRPKWAQDAAQHWLEENEVVYSELHVTYDKPSVHADIYLDDGPHNLVALLEKTNAVVVRYVQPWNRPMQGVHDVNDWQEFIELVKKVDFSKKYAERLSYGN